MRIGRIITTTVLILALITISTTTAAALSCGDGDICVNQSGWWRDGGALNASTTPIQAAVNNATASETIFVYNGSYIENVNVNKRLTLAGEGADVVTVTANQSSDHVFEVTADYVNISGFNASGATDAHKAGILLYGADHCNISDNTASNNFHGIYLVSSSSNTLTSNTASSNNRGIYLRYSSSNTLTSNTASLNDYCDIDMFSSSDNTLVNNTANSNNSYGILLWSSSSNTLTENTASSHGWSGIYLTDSSSNTLTSNTANWNTYGIYLYDSSDYNTFTNNTANSNVWGGIYLENSNGSLIYNNYFNNENNAYDNGVNQWNITKTSGTNIVGGPFLGGNYWGDYAGVDNDYDGLGDTMLPYDSSGNIQNGGDLHPLTVPTPCDCTCGDICVGTSGWWRDGGALNVNGTPIQAAVDNATAGETICVAAGSYTENVDVAKRLTLQGEGAGVVTVTAASSSDHVFNVTADYVNISGFTASGATGSGKAGIYLDSVDNCDISENAASNNRDGISLLSSSSNTVLNNTASSNNKNGIYLNYSSSNTLANNTASNNIYSGIQLDSSSSNTLTNNTANSNNDDGYGYGIYLTSSNNDNTLMNNTANSNGDYGIYLEYSSNNTLANNTANSNNDGIYLHYSNSNMLTGNNCSNNDYGITLYDLSINTLTGNNFSNNNYNGILMVNSSSNTLTENTVSSNNNDGIYLEDSSDNLIYNNYFNNTNNAYDDGSNQWNITNTSGTNIIGGPFLGGNYWGDYTGNDTDGDYLGDTMLPYNSSGSIQNGGDLHPLTATSYNCSCGDICVDETGWWRDGGAFNASTTPIQAAVDNAGSGDVICVKAGSYTENVDIATAHLTLAGEGADVVTVTANQSSDYVFEVTADYVNISGFNATGAIANGMAGFHLYGTDHCNISENTASNNYYGIRLSSSSNNTLTGNTASSNNDNGIVLTSSCNGNTLTSNNASNNGVGIHLESSSNNTLTSNNVSSNNYGIRLYSSSSNTLENNTANSNYGYSGSGIYLYSSSNNTLANNTANLNYGYSGSGIYLYSSSNNTLTSNNANSNILYGISLYRSSNDNTLMSNNASLNNNDNIRLELSSNYNTLTSNNASLSGDHGIVLTSSCNYNTLTGNTANSNSGNGIYLHYSSDSTLTGNTASDNMYGIYLYECSGGLSKMHSGSYAWFSHDDYGNQDTSLNRTVDLTGVTHANLTFWHWYHTESGYDGGRVEVNNGSGWTAITPEGGYPGSGYWNESYAGQSNGWEQATFNLTDYAGQSINLRFRYAGDYSVNYIGWYVDDINISEIGFFDDVESGVGDWTASSTKGSMWSIFSPPLTESCDNTLTNNTLWDIYILSSDSTFTNNTLNSTTISFTYGGDVSLKGVGSPAADPAGQHTIGKFINATNQSAGAWLFLNFSYSDADVGGLVESDLKVWKHNGTTWLEDGWNGTRDLDTAGNVVGVNITSFSIFAPAAPATPPAVTVLRPNGGEEMPGESVYDITWSVTAGTYDFAAGPINISYSNDSGTTWNPIASNEPNNDGRYSWSVPNINSSNCTVNVTVRDVHGNTGSDVSNSTFTILETDNSTSETISEGVTTTVEGPPESNTTVNVTAEGDVTVTVAYYEETPHPEAEEPDGMVPKYIDIAFSNNDNVTWPIYVEMHYTDDEVVGLDESSLGLYYYNYTDGAWHRCSDTGVNVDENYVWANVTADECPGSPFGSGGPDNIPPVITITTPEPDGIYTVDMTLDFSATDDESGVATVTGNLTNSSGVSQDVDSGFAPPVGVYTLVVTATDNAGNTNVSDPVFFVVYDPDGGSATGEGCFDPDGVSIRAKADFEFAVKYKKDVSTGNLGFKDEDADIKLKSTSIDWLVISSVSAQFQGTGTINDEGLYTFRVQAQDNGKPGAGSDQFDINIWNGTDMADLYYKANNTIADGDIKVLTK